MKLERNNIFQLLTALKSMVVLFKKKIFFNVLFIFETETEHERGRGREREGDTESEAGSRLWAVSPEPDAGLELTDHEIVTWAEVGRLTNWATQAPLGSFLEAKRVSFFLEDSQEVAQLYSFQSHRRRW